MSHLANCLFSAPQLALDFDSVESEFNFLVQLTAVVLDFTLLKAFGLTRRTIVFIMVWQAEPTQIVFIIVVRVVVQMGDLPALVLVDSLDSKA